ncbi:MAG: 30S ribosomal protein S3 [Calditrichaeota bacterium]|nr:30S ribosomal protein S3 [Calditrichota bacterium]MCB9366218.1 30S ribosomal protein S3 [Calditrichota bacterium]MCB9391713.1 30S ribosomal protein S3 [Calditrichota bacterium]
MGQKVNPLGLRVGVIRTWNSHWFDERNFADKLEEDLYLRKYLLQRLKGASVAGVIFERTPKMLTLTIRTARPGIVIGRKGAEVDKLKAELKNLTKRDVQVNIYEIKRPELESKLVADMIAQQLEGRVSFRRAMKKAIQTTMRMGAEGIKVMCAGRLGGAEMSRTEGYKEGRVPLHTLRADIDYACSVARTTYGTIGVKVWICRGEVIGKAKVNSPSGEGHHEKGHEVQRRDHDRDRGGRDRGDRRRHN